MLSGSVAPHYITDTAGNRISVILPINEFEFLVSSSKQLAKALADLSDSPTEKEAAQHAASPSSYTPKDWETQGDNEPHTSHPEA